MFKKFITYFLILTVILPIFASAVPIGGGIKRAYAENSDKPTMADPCDLFGVGAVFGALLKIAGNSLIDEVVKALKKDGPPDVSMWNCAAYTFTYLLYDLVMQNAIRLAGLASGLFNVSIQFSLTSDVFDADRNIMIRDGWTMIRDLFNLVFIFILLYAAIATILQFGNMDIKKILPGLIIAALLVNFSLMISKVVIDASHVFSWEFYNQIDATDGNEHPNMENDINVNGNFERKNLANVFLAGFNPQSLLTGKIKKIETTYDKGNKVIREENVESEWYNVVGYAQKEGETFTGTLSRMVLIILMETALAIFSAFILLVVAIMFIARIVILWMVMIFSPIAFIGMVLPGMSKYSKMWLDYLINQSFFAPAFLFMFMLSTKFVNSEMIAGLLNITKNGDISLATGMDGGGIISTFLHFIVVAILMGGSLYVAKLLGGKSAELAQKGRAFAFGGANKMLWKPSRKGLRLGGGAAADAVLEGKGRISGVLKAIPGVSMGLRKLGAMKKADEDKNRKAGEKYAGTLSDSGVASLKRDIAETKGVTGFIKRFAYTGPEGAFKPGKEGYEKIIEKKKAEEEKKKRIAEEREELRALEAVESTANAYKEKFKKEIEKIETSIETLETDLVIQNQTLAKAISDGYSTQSTEVKLIEDVINVIKNEKTKKKAEKTIKEEKIKTIDKQQITRRKELEEKEERRKETEGLQDAIKSSGSSGGKEGGGKTTS